MGIDSQSSLTAGSRENTSVSRFLLIAAFALWALTGPAWLGSVGVAQAGFRPTGIETEGSLFTAGSATLSSDSPGEQDPSPGPMPERRRAPQLFDLPAPQGTSSAGPVSSPVPSGMVGILSQVSVPPPAVVARLWAARVDCWLSVCPNGILDPPRLA
jgi:hypothetical protein